MGLMGCKLGHDGRAEKGSRKSKGEGEERRGEEVFV